MKQPYLSSWLSEFEMAYNQLSLRAQRSNRTRKVQLNGCNCFVALAMTDAILRKS
jgi:hypothetical protein